jgi:hypothetical protein
MRVARPDLQGPRGRALGDASAEIPLQGTRYCLNRILLEAMPTLEDAIALAAEAHAGQTDKAGAPYVLHLLRVMQAQESAEARMAGVLHDLVEDTEHTFEDLEEMGYPDEVIEALRHVTKRDGESYADFARRAGRHRVARRVKTADLEDNMDVTRLDSVGEEDAERLDKYLRAHRRLTGRKETS